MKSTLPVRVNLASVLMAQIVLSPSRARFQEISSPARSCYPRVHSSFVQPPLYLPWDHPARNWCISGERPRLIEFTINAPSPPTTSPSAALMEELGFLGSTCIFFRAKPGIVLKAPAKILEDQVVRERPSVARHYLVERQILDRLGEHPRVVRCLGWQAEFPTGLLLAEASHGSLQHFLESQNHDISPCLRKKWFQQAIESVAYIHSRGVIHCDLRPDNFLVHATSPTDLDLWLCDFGGSVCEELDLDGGGLPDAGFSDPNSTGMPTAATDIFSLGSVLYTIITGHWPYRDPGGLFHSMEEMEQYESRVDGLFKEGIFPDIEGLFGGGIMLGCWTQRYSKVDDILQDLALSTSGL